MVNFDNCGERLKLNAKFCSNCGDPITWPKIIDNEIINRKTNEFAEYIKDAGN